MVSALPCLAGFFLNSTEVHYSGVVFNPIDGYTYLSKMQIGLSGDWLFTLPYTDDPGEGRFLYPFYIFAGQMLRLLPVGLPIWFNLLRLACYGFLVIVLARLAEKLFAGDGSRGLIATFLLCAGGGLGWLLLPFGKFGADFWVAEAYPFLSGLANPHFPLSLALLVVILRLTSTSPSQKQMLCLSLAGIALSILSPFGFVLATGVVSLSWLWEIFEKKSSSIWPTVVLVISGLPYCLYQYWAVNSTPQLAAWTAQNQTPSPAFWDVMLSFSPWLLLLIIGWKEIYTRRNDPLTRRLIVWIVTAIIFSIIPFSLQRRFLFGLYIPTVCLGLLALPSAADRIRISAKKLLTISTGLSILTPVLLLLMVTLTISTRDPLYFYFKDEMNAITWLSDGDQSRSVVLAGSQTGTLIPAASRLQVLYGHPFETTNSKDRKQMVEKFFSGSMSVQEMRTFLTENDVKWIFFGPREKLTGKPLEIFSTLPKQHFGNVDLYSVTEAAGND